MTRLESELTLERSRRMPTIITLPNAGAAAVRDAARVGPIVDALRAEHDAAESSVARAVLLHEMALLELLSGDDAMAAQDALGAINAEPEFAEPLEQLITLVERRQSFRNLAKLLDRLIDCARTDEERTRALLRRAAVFADHEGDLASAVDLIQQATELAPQDAACWVALEAAAGKIGDDALRIRALSTRASLAEPPFWRALLLVDVAQLRFGTGDADGAYATLDQAATLRCEASFAVELVREELARRDDRHDVLSAALAAQADLLLLAIDDASAGDAAGVPRSYRTRAHASDTFARAADALRACGDIAGATALLDRVLERMPEEWPLLECRLRLTELSGDVATAARLAQRRLAAGESGTIAASLWLRVAEAAAAEGNAESALQAVERALREDPACLPARALKLDLLSGCHDPQQLAAALEGTAEQLATDGGKARMFMLSADVWARHCCDAAGAKAALSQAAMCGAPPPVLARVARMLAALTSDAIWYEEATRRLIATSGNERQADVWFELGRARLLRGERHGADAAFESLAHTPEGAKLGRLIRAYVTELTRRPEDTTDAVHDAKALRELADAETDGRARRALRVAIVARLVAGNALDDAIAELDRLTRDDASDAVVAVALAALLRDRGELRRAAEVLADAALAAADESVATALNAEAGLYHWRSGARSRAIECFSRCARLPNGAASTLLAWALRAAEPEDLDTRRKALEAGSGGPDHDALQLERFAVAVGTNDANEAGAALASMALDTDVDLALAAVLARALWQPSGTDSEARLDALSELSQRGPFAAVVANSAAYQLLCEDRNASAEARAEAAARWADADAASVTAALAWVATAMRGAGREHEVEARRALASRLDGELGRVLATGASMVAVVSGSAPERLHQGDSIPERLMNLELALPGSAPARRAAALSGLGDALSDESVLLARALAGWNQLAAGDVRAAIRSFRSVVDQNAYEVTAWEGLRAAAEAAGDRATVAEACAALGDAVTDSAQGAAFWETAATILLDELGDFERGEYALARSVERDVTRFNAFDRLFRLVRARKDGPRLLELVTARLEVAEDPDEIVKLYWERARVLRGAGDRDDALRALENVTMLEPDHVGALALKGEIYISAGQFADAAENLARLASLAEAPTKQRLMSGVAAVDLYENKLNDVDRALKVLLDLYRSDLSTLPVRERLARVAARVGAWSEATEVLEKLMHERETRGARVEAARLAMAIHRDRLNNSRGAAAAVRRLLAEAPDDGEALELLLSDALPESDTLKLLARSREALVEKLVSEPTSAADVDRLARIAARTREAPLRQATLGVLVALGHGSPEIDRELTQLDERVARLPQMTINEAALPELCDPGDAGPLPALVRALAPTIAEALGPSREALGVSKRERIDGRAGLPVRNEVAAWAGALGIGEFELYVGGADPNAIVAVATATPAIVLGSRVSAPLSPHHRQALARELFALRRGTTILRHRDASDVAALIVVVCRLAGYDVAAPAYAMIPEFQRHLTKTISRRLRRSLPELVRPVLETRQETLSWVRAALASQDRMAALAAGDVSHVLSSSSSPRGSLSESLEARERAQRLLSFVLSPSYLTLRAQLGMGVR